MTQPNHAPNYPTQDPSQRRADLYVHLVGCIAILVGAALLIWHMRDAELPLRAAIWIYAACALGSNLASMAYHFSPPTRGTPTPAPH